MADTNTLSSLEGKCLLFGRIRYLGSVGWGITGLLSGLLIDSFTKSNSNVNYLPGLIFALCLLLLNLFICLKLKFSLPIREKLRTIPIVKIFLSLRVLITLFTIMFTGSIMGIIWTFSFIMVEDVAKAWDENFRNLKLLQALLISLPCFIGEAPCLFLSAYLIRKTGNRKTFAVVLSVLSFRCMLYSIVENPWFFIPIDLLNGMTYGLFYANISYYGAKIAPTGATATLQSVVKVCYMAGVSLGGIIGGFLYDWMGGPKMFLVVGIGVAGYTLFFLALDEFLNVVLQEENDSGREIAKDEHSSLLEDPRGSSDQL